MDFVNRGTLIINGGGSPDVGIPIVRPRPGYNVSLRDLGKEVRREEAFALARRGGVVVVALSEGLIKDPMRFFVAEESRNKV